MKKIIPLFLLLCLLCGCSQPAAQETPNTAPATEAVTLPATEPTEVPETTVFQEETVELAAVNAHAFRSSKEKPAVAVMDHRTAAFLLTEYPDKDYSRKFTRVQLVDLHTDRLRTETLLEGAFDAMPYCAAGYLGLMEPETLEVTILDKSLNTVLTFRAGGKDGVLSDDLSSYYFLRGGGICVQDTATEEFTTLEVEFDLAFHELLGYDREDNVLLVSAFTGSYTNATCIGAVDLETGTFLLLARNTGVGALSDGGIVLEEIHMAGVSSNVYYAHWTDGQLQKLPEFLLNGKEYGTWHISGTDYVCRTTYDKIQNVDVVEFELFRLGDTVSVCSLQEELDGAKISRMYPLPDGNLLAVEIGSRGYRTYLICPDLLEFTDTDLAAESGPVLLDAELAENKSDENQWEIPADLTQVRERADELEEEYGITILLSGQCAEPAQASGMTITTTDQAELRNEAEAIDEALDILSEVLQLYPEDFFHQFRNDSGESGLLVMLVEDFESDMNIIGVAFQLGQWYPVAVDITCGEVKSTLCHEIWHATEFRIQSLSAVALDLGAWMNCNPVGFQYSGNMSPSYIRDTQYTYFFGDPKEDVYFIDPYGKINGYEDRARLMEYIMCSDWHSKQILEYPAMRAKLQILCDAIRQVFDTEQWENVHWERFF